MIKRVLFVVILFLVNAEVEAVPLMDKLVLNKGNKAIKIYHLYDNDEENELNRINSTRYIEEMSRELKKRDWVATDNVLKNVKICYVKKMTSHLRISFTVTIQKGENNHQEIYNRLKGDVVIEPSEMVELILSNLE